jgi:hypothetical protein
VQVTAVSFATTYVRDARRDLGIQAGDGRPRERKHAPAKPAEVPRTAAREDTQAALGTRGSNEPQAGPAAAALSAPEPPAPPPVAVAIVPPAEVSSYATRILRTMEASPADVAPGIIELGGGGDTFRATRRPDGGWDVELRAQVDTSLMDQLAAVIYRRVVGRAMEVGA